MFVNGMVLRPVLDVTGGRFVQKVKEGLTSHSRRTRSAQPTEMSFVRSAFWMQGEVRARLPANLSSGRCATQVHCFLASSWISLRKARSYWRHRRLTLGPRPPRAPSRGPLGSIIRRVAHHFLVTPAERGRRGACGCAGGPGFSTAQHMWKQQRAGVSRVPSRGPLGGSITRVASFPRRSSTYT